MRQLSPLHIALGVSIAVHAGLLSLRIANPEACVWSRLLAPRDLQQLFLFPGGNLDHTMLVGGQTFFDRQFSADPAARFYAFGGWPNVSYCGAGAYPCGSIAYPFAIGARELMSIR